MAEVIAPPPIPITVEHFLERLGGYSWFQLWATAVIISPEISAAMIALSPVLTGSSNVFFECETKEGIYNIPPENLCIFKCNGTMRPTGIHTSVVQEWKLICRRAWMTDTLTSIQMLGSMTGAIFAAQFAERFGRKKAFFGLCFMMGAFGFASGWATDPYTFSVARFFAGFAVGGCFVVYLNYLMEFLTPSYRTICGCVSLWAVGEMLLALVGYLLPQWRQLTTTSSLPVFLIFFTYPFIPESPRWLLCQGKTEEAVKVFSQIAKWNHKLPIDPKEIYVLQKEILMQEASNEKGGVRWLRSLKILKNKDIRNQLLVFMFAWFSSSVVYYGISFNMKNLTGDPYLNVLYLGIMDLPGCFSGIVFNNRFGRRKTFLGFLCLGCIFLIALVVVEITYLSQDYPSLVNVLCLLGRYCNSASFAVMACFTAESFPTMGRVTCMGLCALSGNIGGILAPQLAYLGTLVKAVHYLTFCFLTVATATAALLLSDMKGKPLQDYVPAP